MRCYDGCPDSEMQAGLDRQAELMKQIRACEPLAHCTYFLVEGKYQVHVCGRAASGMHDDKEAALMEARSVVRTW
jgi:hypothetical protein